MGYINVIQIIFTVFFSVLTIVGDARAACVNPSQPEGAQVYNSTYKTMQFCDGTTWWTMKGGGGGGGGSGSAIFSRCTNEQSDGDGTGDIAICVEATTVDRQNISDFDLTATAMPISCNVASNTFSRMSGRSLFWNTSSNKWQIHNDAGIGAQDCDDGSLLVADLSATPGSSPASSLWTAGTGDDIYFNSGNGNVGIGTASPAQMLHVSGSGARMAVQTTDNGAMPGYEWKNAAGGTIGTFTQSGGTGDWSLDTAAGGVGNVMVWKYGTGNVGIGTTSPGAKLNVEKSDSGVTADTSATAFFENSTNNLLHIAGGAANTVGVAFNGAGNPNDGSLYYQTDTKYMSFRTANAERMRIMSDGKILVNTTTQVLDSKMELWYDGQSRQGITLKNTANSANGAAIRFIDNLNNFNIGGIFFQQGGPINYATSSDYRLKQNIQPLESGLDRLMSLRPVRYQYKATPDKTIDGFIAHEVQDVVPEAVVGEKDALDKNGQPKYQMLDASKIIPVLTAAMQEQQAEIEALRAVNDNLRTRLDALEGIRKAALP